MHIQKAAQRITGIKDDMVALEAEVRGGIKAKPVHPHPHPVAKGKKPLAQILMMV
jgi:hypothetical protein